jgi:hypothetical protein
MSLHGAPLKQSEIIPCAACEVVAEKMKSLIEYFGCDVIFRARIQILCEEIFSQNEALSNNCAAAFTKNCAHLRGHIENDHYSSKYACQRIGSC